MRPSSGVDCTAEYRSRQVQGVVQESSGIEGEATTSIEEMLAALFKEPGSNVVTSSVPQNNDSAIVLNAWKC